MTIKDPKNKSFIGRGVPLFPSCSCRSLESNDMNGGIERSNFENNDKVK